MPTQQQAINTILGAFNTSWAGNPSYPVVWPNKTPDVEIMKQMNPWAFVKIVHGKGKQVSLADQTGKKLWKQDGVFFCEIYIQSGKGTEQAYALAAPVKQLFAGKEIDGIRFRAISIKEGGNRGNWFLVTVSVDFEYDEIV